MPSTEHKFVNAGYSNIIASISAIAITMALVPGGVLAFLPGWATSKNLYLTLVDAHANREVVKVTAIAGDNLTIERGQDGTVARAWPAGTLVTQRIVAANLAGMIQKEAFRVVTVNPNGTYTAVYPGEKIYQSGPSAGERRWWKNTTGTRWRLIAGDMYGSEYLDADDYVMPAVKIVPASDVDVGWWQGGTFSGGFGADGSASFSFVNSGITTPDDDSAIRYEFSGVTCELKLEDPGYAISAEIDLSIRAYSAEPLTNRGLIVQLFTGATQIASDYVIGNAALGDDDTWLNVAGDETVHTYTIQYLGVVLTAAEAADLRVKFACRDMGTLMYVAEVEAEVW